MGREVPPPFYLQMDIRYLEFLSFFMPGAITGH
jgi:hypothetical protein